MMESGFPQKDADTMPPQSYDAWLEREVREALDDPRPLVSHSEALKRSATRRMKLLASIH